jgi:hypothetical protein
LPRFRDFRAGDARTVRRDRYGVFSENGVRSVCDDRAVDAAAERHHDAAQVA